MASDSDSDDGIQGMDGSDDGILFVSDLVEAASCGDFEDVKSLVTSFHAHIDGLDPESGRTALQVASYQGYSDIVSYLLDNGADVNNKAGTGYAPIHMACENGAEAVIAVLLTYGACVHDREMYNKTPIYIACGRVGNDTIKMLLSLGANPCDKDYPEFNPLNPACESGHYEVVRTLLDHGASMNGWDVFGRTPLQSACYGAYQPTRWEHLARDPLLTVKMLLESGAGPNVPTNRGYNTLEIICCFWYRSNYDADILPTLLDYGTGSGVPCHREHCKCHTTVLMCLYSSFRRDRLGQTSAPRIQHFCDSVCDSFEMHFIKTRTALINSPSEEKGVEPPVENVDWSLCKREAYRSECEAELCRMKTDALCKTSATYFDLLTGNRTALQDKEILLKLNGNHCLQRYPIYGNMIYRSYVRLRMFFMVGECTRFFSIFSPPLHSDCVEEVLKYLSDKDMANLVLIYRAFQSNSKKLCSVVPLVE